MRREAAIEYVEQQGEQKVAAVQEREAQELSRLARLIAAARELANEVKERATAVAQSVSDRLEQFRERTAGWREQRPEVKPEQK